MRKHLITGLSAAALIAVSATGTFAGSAAAPAIEPDVFVDDTAAAGSLGANTGLIVGGLLLLGIAAAAGGSSSDTADDSDD